MLLIIARAISLSALLSWGIRAMWAAVQSLMIARYEHDLTSRANVTMSLTIRAARRIVYPESNWRGLVHASAMLAWVIVPAPDGAGP